MAVEDLTALASQTMPASLLAALGRPSKAVFTVPEDGRPARPCTQARTIVCRSPEVPSSNLRGTTRGVCGPRELLSSPSVANPTLLLPYSTLIFPPPHRPHNYVPHVKAHKELIHAVCHKLIYVAEQEKLGQGEGVRSPGVGWELGGYFKWGGQVRPQ